MANHGCTDPDYCTLDWKYIHWRKCPQDHETWLNRKMAEITQDINEQFTLAANHNVNITNEINNFAQGRIAWGLFATEEEDRTTDDPWAAIEHRYHLTDMYSNFNRHLNQEYNVFHEAVDRRILEETRPRIIH